ncbi:fluoride efflux transporter CrcB [Actinacidiphila soli]|uniref:fluoride efflux transporter CrcB n=1 Tax=Actinacidiphila soli TaxID=2487275 RepID=UPI000FC9EC3A|nr:fluoride efflux transporter CrcB [Actinacidiphila soli]
MSGGEGTWGREGPEDRLRDDLPPAETLPVDPDIAVSAEPQAPPQEPPPGGRRSRQWDVLAVIAVGGGLGSIARYGIAHAWPTADLGFPWATFVTNISGSFALGLLMVYVLEVWPPSRYVRPFLGVGILGGYTTFSTYTVEMRHLLAGTHWSMADAYALTSLIAGLVAVWAGIAVARRAAGLRVRRGPSRRDQTPSAPPPAWPPAAPGDPPRKGSSR